MANRESGVWATSRGTVLGRRALGLFSHTGFHCLEAPGGANFAPPEEPREPKERFPPVPPVPSVPSVPRAAPQPGHGQPAAAQQNVLCLSQKKPESEGRCNGRGAFGSSCFTERAPRFPSDGRTSASATIDRYRGRQEGQCEKKEMQRTHQTRGQVPALLDKYRGRQEGQCEKKAKRRKLPRAS